MFLNSAQVGCHAGKDDDGAVVALVEKPAEPPGLGGDIFGPTVGKAAASSGGDDGGGGDDKKWKGGLEEIIVHVQCSNHNILCRLSHISLNFGCIFRDPRSTYQITTYTIITSNF